MNWGIRPLPGKTAIGEIQRVGLKIINIPGDGDCFFHTVRNHLIEFDRGTDVAGDNTEMRRQLVNYLRYDQEGKRFYEKAMHGVNIGLLLRCNRRRTNTWPPVECFYAISNLYNMNVTIYLTQVEDNKAYHSVHEYWPLNSSRPTYPPVASANWMCVRYNAEHCELLLPINRNRKRKLPVKSFITPVKASKPARSTHLCQCNGSCKTRTCICIKEGLECSTSCHPNNSKCQNHH